MLFSKLAPTSMNRRATAAVGLTSTSGSGPGSTLCIFLFFASFCFGCVAGLESDEILKQVHVITRHGSRHVLRKDSSDLSETVVSTTDSMLTAIGQRQLYDLGVWLRETYTKTSTNSSILDHYDRETMRLESSALERTVTSANSLALGLFPNKARDANLESLLPVMPANVPVYTHDADNDIYIRAYDKCPTFHERLQTLYQSDDWQQYSSVHQQFLAQLAQTTYFQPFSNENGIVPLQEVWNVYDAVQVARTECGEGRESSAACQALADGIELRDLFTDEQWIQVLDLAHLAELKKFGMETAGKVVGINLLKEILARINNGDQTKFSLFSAHYPTILGVFAAIDQVFFKEVVIPDYGSALIFEVTQKANSPTQERYFRIVYKGDDQNENNAVTVNLDHICGNPTMCTVSSLEEYLGGWDVERWCSECDNDTANACLKLMLGSTDGFSKPDDDDDDSWPRHPLEMGFLMGLAVGLIGVGLTVYLNRSDHQKESRSEEIEQAPSYTINSSDQHYPAEEQALPPPPLMPPPLLPTSAEFNNDAESPRMPPSATFQNENDDAIHQHTDDDSSMGVRSVI